MPFQELKSTSPRVFTTGRSRSACRTMESRFCTLCGRLMLHINSNICLPQIREQIKSGQTNDQPNVRPPTQLNNIIYNTYIFLCVYTLLCTYFCVIYLRFSRSHSHSLSLSLSLPFIRRFVRCVNKLHKIVFRGFCFHRILCALFLLRFKYLDYIPVNEFQKRHRVAGGATATRESVECRHKVQWQTKHKKHA